MPRIAYLVENYHKVSATFIRDCAEGLAAHFSKMTVFCRSKNSDASQSGMSIRIVSSRTPNCFKLAVQSKICRTLFDRSDRRIFNVRMRQRELAFSASVRQFRPDLFFAEYGPMGIVAYRLSKEFNAPFIVHFHGYDASREFNDAAYAEQIKDVIASATLILVPSAHMKRLLQIQCGGLGRIEVVPYGPDYSRIEAAVTRSAERTCFPSIAALGRLTAKKNPLALLEAFALVRSRIPDARLTIVGDGEMRPAVVERVRDLDLKGSVELTGALPHEEALRVLATHWIFAQHSVTASDGDQEGLPVAIIEAMALGLPVVSTLHSGIPEAVIEGQTGHLVREHDFESMAKQMIILLNDFSLRKRMGEAGRKVAHERFTLKRRMERICGLIEEVVQGNPVQSKAD